MAPDKNIYSISMLNITWWIIFSFHGKLNNAETFATHFFVFAVPLHFGILKWWKYYNKGNKLVITVGYYITNIEDKGIVIKLPLFKLRKVWIAGGVIEIIVDIEKFFDTSTCDGFMVDYPLTKVILYNLR